MASTTHRPPAPQPTSSDFATTCGEVKTSWTAVCAVSRTAKGQVVGADLVRQAHHHGEESDDGAGRLGGQVNVEILSRDLNIARFFTPYVYGRYSLDLASIYVSRGIGTIGLPIRLGAPPEIALLRLTSG